MARGRRAMSTRPSPSCATVESTLRKRLLVAPGSLTKGACTINPTHGSTPDAVSGAFLRRAESSDVECITLHRLRHHGATLALENL
jgi:integrase